MDDEDFYEMDQLIAEMERDGGAPSSRRPEGKESGSEGAGKATPVSITTKTTAESTTRTADWVVTVTRTTVATKTVVPAKRESKDWNAGEAWAAKLIPADRFAATQGGKRRPSAEGGADGPGSGG